MAEYVYNIVKNCPGCLKERGHYRQKQNLKLLPASSPLKFVAMDILGPLLKTTQESMCHWYDWQELQAHTCFSCIKSYSSAFCTDVYRQFYFALQYSKLPLTDNWLQFVSKFFNSRCCFLCVKQFTTTAYHPQTNGRTEQYNQTIVARLR